MSRQHVNRRGGFGIPTSVSANPSAHDSFNQRLGLNLKDYASQLQVILANNRFTSGGAVINGESAITVSCALEIGSQLVPLFWKNGSRYVKIEPGGRAITEKCGVLCPPGLGETILRTYGKWDIAPDEFPIAGGAMGAFVDYEGNSRGIGSADVTLGTGPASVSTFGVILAPEAIIGSIVRTPVVMLIGDSNRSWSGGVNTGGVPSINYGADGYTMSALIANHYRRFNSVEEAGVTHAFITIAGGDVTGGAASGNLISRALTIKDLCVRQGLIPIFATTPPKTNAGNTAVNSSSIWNAIQGYNTYLRDNNGVGFGYFDLFDVWGSRSTGLWRTDLGTPTDDGTHANSVMHTAASAALAAQAPTLFVLP